MRPSPGQFLNACVAWTCLFSCSAIVSDLADATLLTLVALAALAVNRILEDAADPDVSTAPALAPRN